MDIVQDDGKSIAFEIAYLNGCFVVVAFEYLYFFRGEVLIQFFFVLLRKGNILYGSGIFVFKTCITDITLFKTCSFGKHGDKFPCAHICFFDLKYEVVPCPGKRVKRYLFNEKAFNSLFKIELERGMSIGVGFNVIHNEIIAK